MMESNAGDRAQDIRYEPDERPPHPLALGLGFQYAMLAVAGIVVTPAIVVRAAGAGDDYLTWAAFAALAISGITTAFQAVRIGYIGSGYILDDGHLRGIHRGLRHRARGGGTGDARLARRGLGPGAVSPSRRAWPCCGGSSRRPSAAP